MTNRSVFTALSLPFLAAVVVLGAPACGSEPSEASTSARAPLGAAALGSSASFAVLGGSTVTSTGATKIGGDLGVSPGLAITGFPPGIVTGGVTHAGDAVALQAQTDVGTAYDALSAEACNVDLTGKDLGGLTLVPGVYCFSSSAQLTGALVLDAGGKADAVFVFKMVSTLTTASNASVQVINGGSACNVFWRVGSSATLGTGTTFAGTVIALASITLTTGANVSGRAFARTGAVTMDNNAVSRPACALGSDAGSDAAADAAAPDSSAVDAAPDSPINPPDAGTPDTDAGTPDDSGTM